MPLGVSTHVNAVTTTAPPSTVRNQGTGITVTTTVTTTVPAYDFVPLPAYDYNVIAFNAAGDSVAGTTSTLASGSATNTLGGANAALTAANTLSGAAAGAAGTAATNPALAAATAAAAAPGVAQANVDAVAALSATAAAAPLGPIVANPTPAVPGQVSLVWSNNPLNVNAATGYTNVTGYTLTWSGASSGTATVLGTPTGATITGTTSALAVLPATVGATVSAAVLALPTGATVRGLTSNTSYTFSLVANSPLGSSAPAVTITATAP
jgi:hypothetical protein